MFVLYERGELFAELHSSNGVRQGCPFAAFAFALTVQPLYEAALRAAGADCQAFSIQDDFTIVGPAEQVMKAFDYIKQHALAELGLELTTSKCQVFIPTSTPADDATSIRTLCESDAYHLPHSDHMESLGVMFGPTAHIIKHCDDAVDKSEYLFECLSHKDMPAQSALLLLRYCQLPRLGYLARTTHPDDLAAPAARFDMMAQHTLMRICHLDEQSLHAQELRATDSDVISSIASESDPIQPASQLLLRSNRLSCVSHAQLLERMRQPLSMGGLGQRRISTRCTSSPWYAAVRQAA